MITAPVARLVAGLACGAVLAGCATTAPVRAREQHPTRPAGTPQPSPGANRAARHEPRVAVRLPATSSALAPIRGGVAVAPFGGHRVRVAGRVRAVHAWSTMKVPLIAALLRARRGGELPGGTSPTATERRAIQLAIVDSDNESAERLYRELSAHFGGDRAAIDRIQAELRRAGDARTEVQAAFERPGLTNYGQSRWRLADMARFYRALAGGCLLSGADTRMVLGYMRNVHPIQDWGARAAEWPSGVSLAVKGGWGPARDGEPDYEVLQVAVIAERHGSGAVVAMTATGRGTTFASGTRDLSALGAAVARDLRRLPAGRASCR